MKQSCHLPCLGFNCFFFLFSSSSSSFWKHCALRISSVNMELRWKLFRNSIELIFAVDDISQKIIITSYRTLFFFHFEWIRYSFYQLKSLCMLNDIIKRCILNIAIKSQENDDHVLWLIVRISKFLLNFSECSHTNAFLAGMLLLLFSWPLQWVAR